MEQRRRWDLVYRWLNGALFLLLAAAMLAYFLGLFEMIEGVFYRRSGVGLPLM